VKKSIIFLVSIIQIACSNNNQISSIKVSDIILLKSSKPTEQATQYINRQALLTGKLIIKENCLYVENINSYTKKRNNVLTVWSWKSSINNHGRDLIVHDNNIKNSAAIGKLNRFSGGYVTMDKEFYNGCRIYGKQIFGIDIINPEETDNNTRQLLKKYMKR